MAISVVTRDGVEPSIMQVLCTKPRAKGTAAKHWARVQQMLHLERVLARFALLVPLVWNVSCFQVGGGVFKSVGVGPGRKNPYGVSQAGHAPDGHAVSKALQGCLEKSWPRARSSQKPTGR